MNYLPDTSRMSIASTILMIRPAAFGFNEETAVNNYFQAKPEGPASFIQQKAISEFDVMVQLLSQNGIEVIVMNDTPVPPKPGAVFPNNWLSTSPGGIVSVFPLYAPSRRAEKRDDILKQLADIFIISALNDWSEFEAEGRFLEGTGSMVIDHDNKMIYAAASERTSQAVLEKFAGANGYQAILFLATDKKGRPVYHTNVMMTLGEGFCVLCEEAIEEEWELIAVRQLLESTGHLIIPITREQMQSFAGNMLQVKSKSGEKFIVLSMRANHSLRLEQKQMIEAFGRLLPVPVPTIEEVEGGSVRCMMAEIFLSKR